MFIDFFAVSLVAEIDFIIYYFISFVCIQLNWLHQGQSWFASFLPILINFEQLYVAYFWAVKF